MSPIKTLLTILLLTTLGIGAGIAIYSLTETSDSPRKLDLIPVSIVDLRLNVPRTFFRGGNPPSQSMSERIDLVMLYPEMAPSAVSPTKVDDAPNPQLLVFASIQRNDGVIDPAERVQDLYGRFLEAATFDSPGGLLMKRFNADSPYGDEELFIAPPDGRIFAARCRKPEKTSAQVKSTQVKSTHGIGEMCLWRFRQAGADFQIRFSPALLPQWEDMALGIAKRLKQWEGK